MYDILLEIIYTILRDLIGNFVDDWTIAKIADLLTRLTIIIITIIVATIMICFVNLVR